MKTLSLYDLVRFKTNTSLTGIVTGVITRPGTTTYLIRVDSDIETEHYRNELEPITNSR